ncbi:MAG: hypothetical protein ACLU4J_03160 [Butyricimonas paravirosa]
MKKKELFSLGGVACLFHQMLDEDFDSDSDEDDSPNNSTLIPLIFRNGNR